MNEKQEMAYVIEGLFPSKVYCPDVIYDMGQIISSRLLSFRQNIDDFEKERAEEHLKEITEFIKDKPKRYEFSNRLYVISGVQCVNIACVSLSDKAIENIVKDMSSELMLHYAFPLKGTNPNFVSTLYIFQKDHLTYFAHVFPSHSSLVLTTLGSKSIVDYKIKKRWTIKD